MIILALVVIGAVSYTKLAVDRLPEVEMPTIRVATFLPGATPEEMESEVSELLEEQINTVQGIYELRSISGPGPSFIIVTFDLDRNVDVCRRRSSRAPLAHHPRTAQRHRSAHGFQVRQRRSAGPHHCDVRGPPAPESTEYADKVIRPQLERSAGVGEVAITGGFERAINVWVDPDRLRAYGLPITAVRDAMVRQNSAVPGGNLTQRQPRRKHAHPGRIRDPKDFEDVVVESKGSSPDTNSRCRPGGRRYQGN